MAKKPSAWEKAVTLPEPLPSGQAARPPAGVLGQGDHDVFGPPGLARGADREAGLGHRLLPRRQAGQGADHRHGEFVEGEDGAGREARQHHHRLAADGAEAERLARLQRHAMHQHARRRQAREDAVGDVAGALRGAARHHHQVGHVQRLAQGGFQRRLVVAEDAHGQRLAAVLGDGGGEDGGVAVVDPAHRQRLAGRDQLVAGREDGDAGAAHHRHGRQPGGGQHADLPAGDEGAGPQHRLAAGDVAAGIGHRLPGDGRAAHQHHGALRAFLGLGLLDHDHGIGAARDDAAGGDGRRRARGDRDAGRHAAGQQLGVQPQPARRRLGGAEGIGGAQREAIHRGAVEGRRIGGGGDRHRHHPAERGAERHGFGRQRGEVDGGMEARGGHLGGDDVEELLLPGGAADTLKQIGVCQGSHASIWVPAS